MQIKSQEHYDLMNNFENIFKGNRFDKEPKEMWKMGVVYQDGKVNELFKAFRQGYALHKALANLDAA